MPHHHPYQEPLPVPGLSLDREAKPFRPVSQQIPQRVAPDPFFQELTYRPNKVPGSLAEIRTWIARVEASDPEQGDPRYWPDTEVLAHWNNIWKPVVEEAECNPPSLMEIAKAQVFATTVQSHQNLEPLTPAQLAVYLRPMIRASATNAQVGTEPGSRFASRNGNLS
jgi:hypothetical protein